MQHLLNTVTQGDCLEVMQGIPDRSIDLILCDLPYGQGSTGLGWDVIIDPVTLWQHYERVIKLNGALLFTATMPFGASLIMQKLDWFKYDLIWRKGNGNSPGIAKYRPLPVHESILVFSPNRTKITYNPQMRNGFKNWWKTNSRVKDGEECQQRNVKYGYKEMSFRAGQQDGKRYPISVLETSKPNYPVHPTQKPVELFEYLIRTYSNEGDLVLDNCAGSGTTAVAAYNTGRNFICIEKDAGYHAKAVKRLQDVQAQLRFDEMAG